MNREIRVLTDPRLDTIHGEAWGTGVLANAWRLEDGREVLMTGGIVYLWTAAAGTTEIPVNQDTSPKEVVRRHDLTQEIRALLAACGFPGAWEITWNAIADGAPVDVRLDGQRLPAHGWWLLQSQGYALPPWECAGYGGGRRVANGARLCCWCAKTEGEHTARRT